MVTIYFCIFSQNVTKPGLKLLVNLTLSCSSVSLKCEDFSVSIISKANIFVLWTFLLDKNKQFNNVTLASGQL